MVPIPAVMVTLVTPRRVRPSGVHRLLAVSATTAACVFAAVSPVMAAPAGADSGPQCPPGTATTPASPDVCQPVASPPAPARPGHSPADKKQQREQEQRRKEQQQAAHEQALAALASAQTAMAEIQPRYQAAQAALVKAQQQQTAAAGQLQKARSVLAATVRAVYMQGIDPGVLAQTAALTADNPDDYLGGQTILTTLGRAHNNDVNQARHMIDTIDGAVQHAQADLDTITPQYDLVSLNLAAARADLGLGDLPHSDPGTFYTTYPVPACSFATTTNTTRSCTDAMRFALAEASHPSRDWYYLCLNFVTVAYGAPQSIPRAIDMWNGLPTESKHDPNTVAPAGALMFWAPNHVALSLGNNMLASTDVLGNGRIWIVSMSTIQARWNMPYLGWADPDFSGA